MIYQEEDYLQKLLAAEWEKCLSGTLRSLYIHTACQERLAESLDAFAASVEAELLNTGPEQENFSGPYPPFLHLVSRHARTFSDTQLEKFLEKSGVYSLHNHILYFFTARAPKASSLRQAPLKKPVSVSRQLTTINNAFHFLCFEECRETVEDFHNQWRNKTVTLQAAEQNSLLSLLGEVSHHQGNFDTALIYFNNLLSLAQEQGEERAISYACRKISYAYHQKANYDDAERFARQSLKLARNLEDTETRFYAWLNLFLIQEKAAHENMAKYMESFYNVEKLAQQLEKFNLLAYCYGIMVTQVDYLEDEDKSIGEKMFYCDLIINIASQYDNKNRLAAAYHNKGMLYSYQGQHEAALPFYKKSEKLKRKIGNKLELIRICNGMGYGYFLAEDYHNANKYYWKARKQCYNNVEKILEDNT